MANRPIMGDNRTGTARAPTRCEEMLSGNLEFAPPPSIDDTPITEVRIEYATESIPLGTVPPPASVKQVGKSVVAKLKGTSPTVFVDKLGARLAFERNGVRLYQALVSKFDAYGSFDGGPARAELVVILEQEQEHFALLKRAMEKLGGDPDRADPFRGCRGGARNGSSSGHGRPAHELLAIAQRGAHRGACGQRVLGGSGATRGGSRRGQACRRVPRSVGGGESAPLGRPRLDGCATQSGIAWGPSPVCVAATGDGRR